MGLNVFLNYGNKPVLKEKEISFHNSSEESSSESNTSSNAENIVNKRDKDLHIKDSYKCKSLLNKKLTTQDIFHNEKEEFSSNYVKEDIGIVITKFIYY